MTAAFADERAQYRITVQGRLEPQSAARLGDLSLTIHESDGDSAVTVLTGWISDQAALMGTLDQLYGLGVTILSVERLDQDTGGSAAPQ